MKKTLVNIGDKFGTLTVAQLDGVWASNGKKRTSGAICKCDCGNTTPAITLNKLKRMTACLQCAQAAGGQRRKTHGCSGDNKTPEYVSWKAMRTRCTNARQGHAGRYIDRGITYCERWDSFENFLADMGEKPTPKHSLDRIDNDSHYSPENCRWATQQEQTRNTCRSIYITHDGITLHLIDWATRIGIARQTLYVRLYVYGWDVERALTEPRRTTKRRHGLA
jgi:hypothetical protein